MSFSTEVKNELCRVSMQRACCTRAEVYGAPSYASVFAQGDTAVGREHDCVSSPAGTLQRRFVE